MQVQLEVVEVVVAYWCKRTLSKRGLMLLEQPQFQQINLNHKTQKAMIL